MKKVLLFTLILITSITSAQNEGNWWYFGRNAVIDFNSGVPVSNQIGQLNTFESCSSISDRFGNLLFYTDGSTVWNALGNPVPNGTGLSGNASTAQNLIVQDVFSTNLFYIITTGGFQGLRYSLFDINLDSGLGAIVPSTRDILIANINTEKIHGYQDDSGNRWIVTYDSGIFYSYSFGSGVISNSSEVVSDLSMSTFMNSRFGCLKISPDGNKIAIASVGQFAGLFIADFNKSTGIVSNPIRLFNSTSTFDRTYGIEFSPDSRYLYTETSTTNTGNSCGVGNIKKIFQYDIYFSGNWSNNPIDISGDLIDESRGSLQLGPDGKIYVAFNCKPYLGVISDPTRPGVAANFIQNAVPLYNDTVNMVSSHSAEGLPNVLSQRYFNTYNNIEGRVSLDVTSNGCNLTDPGFPSLNLEFTSPTYNTMSITDSNGSYLSLMIDESYTITPNPENSTYWNFSPPNVVVDFPTQSSPFTQDFCVTANGTIEDLEVIVVPLEQARPGFDTNYKVVIKNKGNVTASGSVTLDFEEDFMTLLSSNPNAGNTPSNQLSWSFSNLQPFQMSAYEFTMTLNTPTQTVNPLNSNDILTFTGTLTGTGTDAMPADNIMVLDQTVVNSYDPNDKTCLEGKVIQPSLVGEYVHYMIRFENTGTASAINVVIKDEIDLAQFDITTLIPLGGSHDYYTRLRDNNVVEFIHENINLDFNDATNDGYVLFKIKTLSTLIEGDTFDNTAEIYFDFNFPIITNTETVTIMSTASIGETTDTSISVYPNPARDFINISSTNGLKSAAVIDVNGRMLSQTNFIGNTTEQRISLENLTSGVYFVTIQSEEGQKVEKVIVD